MFQSGKRLTFSKETLRALGDAALRGAIGGSGQFPSDTEADCVDHTREPSCLQACPCLATSSTDSRCNTNASTCESTCKSTCNLTCTSSQTMCGAGCR
jgi:hypothetical protein